MADDSSIPQFENLEEAMAWLQMYGAESDDKAWMRCYAIAVVYAQFPGEDTIAEMCRQLRAKRRSVFYWKAAALDWPPEKRYQDHSCDWHVAVSEAARSQVKRRPDYHSSRYNELLDKELEAVGEACVLHDAGFVRQVTQLVHRQLRKAQDEDGMTERQARDRYTFETVMKEVQDKKFADVYRMTAEICPTCGQRLPWVLCGKGIGIAEETRG